VGRIILIYWSAKLALNNEITTGMLFAFLLYSNIFTNKIRQLLNSFQYAKVLQIQLNRIEDIVTHRPESLPEDELCTKEISIDGNLELKDVSFRYSRTAEHLFKNINLRIKRGEYVCIVGRTGCGKTSLMKLLLGLYSPSSGLILYDGLPLNAVGHKNLRNQIAAVMQDDELSTGSIYQNICDGSLPYDQEWAKECARMALIDKEINKMTMNYYTNVGERGRSLSAGQRQRVLLAKAIYKRPKIIFMDEATAFLDESIERKINDNLRAMNITRVAIAHRADTIRSADRILMLSKDGLSSLDIKGLGKKEGPIIKQRQKDASVESAVQQ
jgi:ATP-binding cassette subfamily B protein RaxB